MKSILDSDFEYTPSVETDIRATFERIWRELDTRDQSHTSSGEDYNSVWLECNGELVDSCSVKVLRVRKSSLGFEMVEFVCPGCKQRHESPQFR
jgi:hypothetical protein